MPPFKKHRVPLLVIPHRRTNRRWAMMTLFSLQSLIDELKKTLNIWTSWRETMQESIRPYWNW
jgi:hypothetical protein